MLKASKLWMAGMISLFLFVIGLPNWWVKAANHAGKFAIFSALIIASVFSTSPAIADVLHLKCDFRNHIETLPYAIDIDTASKTVIRAEYEAPTYPFWTGSEISIQEFDDRIIKFEITDQYGTRDFSIDRFTGEGGFLEHLTTDGNGNSISFHDWGAGPCSPEAQKF